MKTMSKIILVVGIVMFLASPLWAADQEQFPITATISAASQLNVEISEIVGAIWTAGKSAVDFGTLTWNPTYGIFEAGSYYAVDVGIVANSGNWSIQHTTTPITNGTDNLDGNVNTSFIHQINSAVGLDLDKVSYANANGKTYGKAQLTPGWLRIYYGVGTGKDDNPGVTPVGADKSAGTYTGQITISLTP